jgi:hypothetical protein
MHWMTFIHEWINSIQHAIEPAVRVQEPVEISWNGRDVFGNPVSSGVYLYGLTRGKQAITRKMVLIR